MEWKTVTICRGRLQGSFQNFSDEEITAANLNCPLKVDYKSAYYETEDVWIGSNPAEHPESPGQWAEKIEPCDH